MSFTLFTHVPKGANRLLLLQGFIAILTAVIFSVCFGLHAGYSALIGGLVCVLANWIFVKKCFANKKVMDAKRILLSVYLGEIIKVLVSIVLFVLVFKFISIVVLPFFIGYILVQFMFWFSPLLFSIRACKKC